MSSKNLLALARIISKDPDPDTEYPKDTKYAMLSMGQEALATYLHYSYLRSLVAKKTHASLVTPGTVTSEPDFLRIAYWELADGTPIDFIEIQQKGLLESEFEGGTDIRPRYIMYREAEDESSLPSNLKFQVLVDTYPVANSNQYYVVKPPQLSDSSQPLILGFDHLIGMYFKHLYHLAEGQAQLAQVALENFFKTIDDLNSKLRS